MKILSSVLLFSVSTVLSQKSPPPFPKIGCPHPELPAPTGKFCFSRATSCVPNLPKADGEANWPDVPDNNNVYKIIRARSWWFCGNVFNDGWSVLERLDWLIHSFINKTRTTIVVSNGRYTFYQIHFIKHNSSYTIYQIPFIKYPISNTIYQIPFIKYLL